MNIIIRLLQIVTLIPYLLCTGYSFFVRKEVLLGLLFLGLEAFSYFWTVEKNA